MGALLQRHGGDTTGRARRRDDRRLVPLFFLSSGIKLDLASVVTSADGLALLAAFFVALVVVRGPLAILLRRALGGRGALAVALLSATTLSLVVVISPVARPDADDREGL